MAEMQMMATNNMTMPMTNAVAVAPAINGAAVNSAAMGEAQFLTTSLYVSDLDTNVTDSQVFQMFKTVAEVVSVRVCRDIRTRRSLGYAYVNFSNTDDAARALEMLNFAHLGNTCIRIMYANHGRTRHRMRLFPLRVGQYHGQGPPNNFVSPQPGFGLPPQMVPGMRPGAPDTKANFFMPIVHPNQHAPMHQIQNQQGMRDAPVSHAVPIGTELVTSLVNATPDQRRTMLRDRLYPLLDELEHDNAAKVTDMLLRLDTAEVLHLMESPEDLNAKVSEAMEVLRTDGIVS